MVAKLITDRRLSKMCSTNDYNITRYVRAFMRSRNNNRRDEQWKEWYSYLQITNETLYNLANFFTTVSTTYDNTHACIKL